MLLSFCYIENYQNTVILLGGVALTTDIKILCMTGGTSSAVKALTYIGAVASGVNLFDTTTYYSTAGGAPCNVCLAYTK